MENIWVSSKSQEVDKMRSIGSFKLSCFFINLALDDAKRGFSSDPEKNEILVVY